jgi:hypothetical protein
MKIIFMAKIKGVQFKCHGIPEASPEMWNVACEHSDYNGVCGNCAREVLQTTPLMEIQILHDNKWVRYVDLDLRKNRPQQVIK